MCDVINIRLKRRIAARSGKGNQLLNIETTVEQPILNLGLQILGEAFTFSLFLVASQLLRRNFMMPHIPLSSVSIKIIEKLNF